MYSAGKVRGKVMSRSGSSHVMCGLFFPGAYGLGYFTTHQGDIKSS